MPEAPNPTGLCFCGCGETTRRALKTDSKHGNVKGEHVKFASRRCADIYRFGTAESRFWARVEKTSSCWLWTGTLKENGYGFISDAGQRFYVHRYAYELLVGPIPDGLVIDHVYARGCRNRHCVNPAHLEAVTQDENSRRGRRTYGDCPKCGSRFETGNLVVHARSCLAIAPTCPAGHKFTPENTYIWGRTKYPHRKCRKCHAERERRRRARARAKRSGSEAAA